MQGQPRGLEVGLTRRLGSELLLGPRGCGGLRGECNHTCTFKSPQGRRQEGQEGSWASREEGAWAPREG